MGRAIVAGGARMTVPCRYDPVFSNNTWEDIIDACQKNNIPKTWSVGDQKTMTINGTDYPIDIIGKNHDTYWDGSGNAPLTFQMHDCYGVKYSMNSSDTTSGGWASSLMRTNHLPSILELMPSEIKTRVREITKTTTTGGSSAAFESTKDKLFLLSEMEVFGVVSYSHGEEGKQYEYYKAGNSKVKTCDGSSSGWWTRSPYGDDKFDYVLPNESSNPYYAGYAVPAISFAFCF